MASRRLGSQTEGRCGTPVESHVHTDDIYTSKAKCSRCWLEVHACARQSTSTFVSSARDDTAPSHTGRLRSWMCLSKSVETDKWGCLVRW
jgi:hypothetical protein